MHGVESSSARYYAVDSFWKRKNRKKVAGPKNTKRTTTVLLTMFIPGFVVVLFVVRQSRRLTLCTQN